MKENFDLQCQSLHGVTVLSYDELFRKIEDLIGLIESPVAWIPAPRTRVHLVPICYRNPQTCVNEQITKPGIQTQRYDSTDGVKYQVDFGFDQTALVQEWQIVKD
jgi:hypothetical protein